MKSMKMMPKKDKLIDVTFEENSEDFKEKKEMVEYPFGLRICLNEDSLSLLGVKDLPNVGEKMKLMAMVEVCSVSQFKTDDGAKRNVDLQIVEMDLSGKSKVDPDKMYAKQEVAQPVNEVSE